MSQEKQLKNLRLAAAMTIAVFCMGQIPGSIDAAISKITVFFNLSSTSGLIVTTSASLASVAFSFLLGVIAGKKVGFKPLIMFCAIVELISSIAPFFTESFVMLIILRSLFGLGFGGMMALENTVATRLISPEKRAQIIGLGTFFGFGTNCILQLLGGILADRGWNYVFLNHLLLFIPFVVIVVGCLKLDFGGEEKQNIESAEYKSQKLGGGVFQAFVLMFFAGVMIAPLLIGCSFLSEPINPSATVAGIVAVCFSVGCMAGGIIFSGVYKLLKNLTLTAFLLAMAAGILACGITRSIVVLCIVIFIAGVGFSGTQATCMTVLGICSPKSKIAFSSAVMMALFNLGMFTSSPYESLVGKITGDALYTPLYIGSVVIAAFAIAYAIKSPLKVKGR